MKNRKLAWILGVVLVAGMIAGCGSEKKTEENTTVTESQEEEREDSEEADETENTEETEDAEEEDAEATDSEETETSEDTEDTAEDETAASEGVKGDFDSATASVAGWNLTVEDVELNSSLENVSVELGYTSVETNDFKKEAEDGKNFCLIKMKIEKDGSKESIDWKNMTVTDSEGNTYERISDEFLTDLGMMRMPGNTLNFGSNEGWIIYEVNEGAEGLQLNYNFESEEYSCTLTK